MGSENTVDSNGITEMVTIHHIQFIHLLILHRIQKMIIDKTLSTAVGLWNFS